MSLAHESTISSDIPVQNTIPIQPVDRVKTTTISGFQIRVLGVELFQSVTVSVLLFSNGAIVDNQVLTLSGDDYSTWTSDDRTLIQCVATKLGFTIA
jgi:hypothetical protein